MFYIHMLYTSGTLDNIFDALSAGATCIIIRLHKKTLVLYLSFPGSKRNLIRFCTDSLVH